MNFSDIRAVRKSRATRKGTHAERPMIWTMELASYLDDAPWPATKEELIDYAIRTGAPVEVIENLQELDDTDEPYESMEDIWPDYPTEADFFFGDENEY
jgi:hypothetical protein